MTRFWLRQGAVIAFDGVLSSMSGARITDSPRSTGYRLAAALQASAYVVGRAWVWGRRWLVWLVVVNLVSALVPAGQVLAVAWLVSSAEAGGSLAVPVLTLTVLVGLGQLAGELGGITWQRAGTQLHRHYLNALVQRVAAAPPQQLGTAETTARIEACRASGRDLSWMAGAVIVAVGTVVTTVSLCVSVWRFSAVAGLLVAAVLIPVVVAYARVARNEDAYFVPYGEQTRRAGYLVEQLVGQRSATELATLGSGRKMATAADEHRGAATALMDAILSTLGRSSAVGSLVTAALLGAALVAIVVGGGGSAGLAGGVLGVIAGMAANRAGGFAFGELIATAPKVEAFRALLDDLAEIPVQPIGGPVASVELADVRVTYPHADRPALDQVSLRVPAGTIVAFVGVNGAGKTTAVNALLGIVDLESGTVRIDGGDASTLPLERRLGMFGLLTQEFGRYDLTVRDTVALGTPGPVSDDQVWAALASAHAADLVSALPAGLDTQLGPQFGGVGLSGGQWQRLALARIYLRDAPVWLLDEPTSAIDAEAEQRVFADLQRQRAGRITIVVSHRAWTLKGMDQIYVFDHGRIVEQGRYEQLINARGRFAAIFAEQA